MNHCGDNKGTPQFWKLLAASAEGYNYISPKGELQNEDLGKGLHQLNGCLQKKLSILQAPKLKGVQLLDTAIFGWHHPETGV